jgi:hypothetical protein
LKSLNSFSAFKNFEKPPQQLEEVKSLQPDKPAESLQEKKEASTI